MKATSTKFIIAIFLLLLTLSQATKTTALGESSEFLEPSEQAIEEANYYIIESEAQEEQAITANIQPRALGSGIEIELKFSKSRFVYFDEFIEPDNHIIAGELFSRSINADFSTKREIMSRCLKAGGSYKTAVLYTMPRLEAVVDKAIAAVNLEPTDSTMEFFPDEKPMFKITREKAGRRVAEERLYMKIYSALMHNKTVKITIEPDILEPDITAYDNIKLTKMRTRYKTGFPYSSDNRKHNINLALTKVNGTVLAAGEEFSFNKTVGRRTEANGFKESPIIVGGKYENGTGGGVCQVSTTLYNAALLSGLKVTAVRNHSLECSYELPSFDAMVNAGSQDLKFKNTDKTSVFIRAYCIETSAVIEIFGAPQEYEIRRHSEVIYRKDPPKSLTVIDTEYKYHTEDTISGTTKIISYSHGEMKSEGYLLYYNKSGHLVKKTKIREDVYHSVAGLIAVAP